MKYFVTTSKGMAGYYALVYDSDGQIIFTGVGRYATKEQAMEEAEEISISEGIELK